MDKDGGCRFTNPLVVVILGYRPEGRGAGDVMRANGVAALCAAGLILAGCASVTRGTSEPVVFDSEPAGAEMRSVVDYPCGGPCAVRDDKVGNAAAYIPEGTRTEPIPGPACITPCTVQVARNEGLVVTFSKAGYQPQTVKLDRVISGSGGVGFAGNVIIGGGIGMVTDGITGAATDHKPNPLKVTLVPLAGAPRPKR